MRIVNTTGFSMDTKVLDDEGKDITAELKVVKITIEAGDQNRVILTCDCVEVDIVGDEKQP